MSDPDGLLDKPDLVLEDALDEAMRLIGAARSDGLSMRLFGGIAVYLHIPHWSVRKGRPRKDIDFVIRKEDRRGIEHLLERLGYVPDKQQNALYGHKQLYFIDAKSGRPIDVVVDRLEMCHTLELRDRLGADQSTLPIADLVLSKLQIVKPERKDLLDVIALLCEFPLTPDDDGISMLRIVQVLSADWGWWRTSTGNLDQIALLIPTLSAEELDFGRSPRYEPFTQVTALRRIIDDSSKSLKWKVRAKVGDRAVWYDEPEEVDH